MIEEIKQVLAETTNGEWEWEDLELEDEGATLYADKCNGRKEGILTLHQDFHISEQDMNWIANSKRYCEWLLGQVERLKEERDWFQQSLNACDYDLKQARDVVVPQLQAEVKRLREENKFAWLQCKYNEDEKVKVRNKLNEAVKALPGVLQDEGETFEEDYYRMRKVANQALEKVKGDL